MAVVGLWVFLTKCRAHPNQANAKLSLSHAALAPVRYLVALSLRRSYLVYLLLRDR